MNPGELFIFIAAFLGASMMLAPILERISHLLRTRQARDIERVLALRAALRGWEPVNQKNARPKGE